MTYTEKLKSPLWQKKRLEILNRDKFTCRCCRSTEKTLHVHHRYYEKGKAPWEYPDEVFLTLCEECHEIEGERLAMLGRMVSRHDDASFIVTSLAESINPENGAPNPALLKFLTHVTFALRAIESARTSDEPAKRIENLSLASRDLLAALPCFDALLEATKEEE